MAKSTGHTTMINSTSTPVPTLGCDVCAALAKQRVEARQAGDFSRVTDCNVEMRRHHESA